MSWFHCGRCGSLFLSEAGNADDRLCTECGRDPSLGVESPLPTPVVAPTTSQTALPAAHSGHAKRPERRGKSNFLMAKLAFGWILLLVAIIFLANRFLKSGSGEERTWKPKEEQRMTAEELKLLQDSSGICQQLLAGFFGSGTPETRTQFVLNAVATVPDMIRYYGLNPPPTIESGSLRSAGMSVIHLPEGEAIEGRWMTDEGQVVDAVFRRERGEWKIDWHDLVRYGDYPWSLYLAGTGEPEAEFRLYVRKRSIIDPDESKPLSVVFYGPRFGHPTEPGAASPEFVVPRDSRNGRLLAAAFKLAENGKRPFGGLMQEINPDGMVRVRVKVRRTDDEMQRNFELLEVIACHWLSIDDPGVDPDAVDEADNQADAAVESSD